MEIRAVLNNISLIRMASAEKQGNLLAGHSNPIDERPRVIVPRWRSNPHGKAVVDSNHVGIGKYHHLANLSPSALYEGRVIGTMNYKWYWQLYAAISQSEAVAKARHLGVTWSAWSAVWM